MRNFRTTADQILSGVENGSLVIQENSQSELFRNAVQANGSHKVAVEADLSISESDSDHFLVILRSVFLPILPLDDAGEPKPYWSIGRFVGNIVSCEEYTGSSDPFVLTKLAVNLSKEKAIFVSIFDKSDSRHNLLSMRSSMRGLGVEGLISFKPPSEDYNKPSITINNPKFNFLFKPKDQQEVSQETKTLSSAI